MGADTAALKGMNAGIQLIALEGGPALGLQITLGKAPLLLVAVPNGYVMCGYLNVETANKLGDCAGRVSGVATLDALLEAKINAVSDAAKTRGLREGMTGRDFLNALLRQI
jgi:uncharacterized protein YunC (DUF1805 family)